jgi:large subunit ribosomal protein L10
VNIEQKAAVINEVAEQIRTSDAIFAVDYRGLSVKDAAELRGRLIEAGATFRVVKNRLTIRAADQAGAESLKELLEGPTALTFVTAEGGDAALAAKALAQFRRQTETLAFKGGRMNGEPLSIDQIESISRLPARDVLQGQFVGVLASPITTLVRGLASMISGLASQLKQIEEQGLVTGAPPEPVAEEAPAAEAEAPAEEAPAEEAETPAEEAEAPTEEPEAEAEAPADEAAAEPEAEAEAEAEAPAAEAEPEQEAEVAEEPAAEAEPEAAEEESSETPSEGE